MYDVPYICIGEYVHSGRIVFLAGAIGSWRPYLVCYIIYVRIYNICMIYHVHCTCIVEYMHSGRIVFPAGAVGSWRPSGVDLQPYRTTTDGAPHYRLQPIDDRDEDLIHFDHHHHGEDVNRADGGDGEDASGDESVPFNSGFPDNGGGIFQFSNPSSDKIITLVKSARQS